MNKDSFIFYTSFYDAIEDEDDETRLEALDVIIKYATRHDVPNNFKNKGAKIAFKMAKPQLDANFKKSMEGSKGGRPSKSKSSEELEDKDLKTEKPLVIEEKTIGFENKNHRLLNKKPNVNVNDNVNVNENVNVKYKYGDHSHVLLTDNERSKLDEKYPNAKELIQFLDDYIEDKPKYGKEHKSHYRCIETWVVDAVNERKNKNVSTPGNNVRTAKQDIVVNYSDSGNKPLSDNELEALKVFRNGWLVEILP